MEQTTRRPLVLRGDWHGLRGTVTLYEFHCANCGTLLPDMTVSSGETTSCVCAVCGDAYWVSLGPGPEGNKVTMGWCEYEC